MCLVSIAPALTCTCPDFKSAEKLFLWGGKNNQMLSTWRLHPGHHSMETKATCLGGGLLGRPSFATECPDEMYQWKSDQRMGCGKTSGVNSPCYCSCKNYVEMDIFVHPCHLAQHELCLCIQKASLYDSSNILLSAVFKICSPVKRENTGIYLSKRLGRTHVLFSGQKQNAHQNTSEGKPITFYFEKALIFYSCHYVLKTAQVFIGSYPVQSHEGGDTCFSSCSVHLSLVSKFTPCPHQCCSNSVDIWSHSCVFPLPAALWETLKGFLPVKVSVSDPRRATLRCIPNFPQSSGLWSKIIRFATSAANWSTSYFKMLLFFLKIR